MMDGLNWMDQPLAPVAFKVNRDYFCQGDVYVIRQLKEKTKFFMLPFASTYYLALQSCKGTRPLRYVAGLYSVSGQEIRRYNQELHLLLHMPRRDVLWTQFL